MTYQQLSEYTGAVRKHSVGMLWVDCLIKPTLLALQLLHVQRDGNFLLQQVSLEAMMHYFFVGRAHELRPLYDLVSEERWSPANGGQERPNEGLTCMSSLRRRDDSASRPIGEQTHTRRGKGAGGLTGISTNA